MSDHDALGQLSTFTAITPIEPGRERDVRESVRGLPAREQSPMGRVPGTHLARLFVIDALPHVVLKRNHLLFGAAFDGPRRPYLLALHSALGDQVERIWGGCAGFPARGRAEEFADWLEGYRVPALAVVAAFPQAGLERVRGALDLRHRIGLFAVRNQSRAPEDLLRAFQREFGAP